LRPQMREDETAVTHPTAAPSNQNRATRTVQPERPSDAHL